MRSFENVFREIKDKGFRGSKCDVGKKVQVNAIVM